MYAISYSAARANLAKTMEKICDDHAPVIITRKSESPVVMVSLADYQAMEETAYLLRLPVAFSRQRPPPAGKHRARSGGVSASPPNPQRLTFSSQAWGDYLSITNRSGLYWPLDDQLLLQRINSLIKEIQRQPFEGISKPERLKHGLSGYWSRCINDEHRIVYKITDDQLLVAQLRYHYEY